MDALVNVCSRTWMILWFVHGCSASRMLANMDVIMVSSWTPWQTYALEHGFCYGLGMDALVNVCSRTWMLLCFGHGFSGKRMLSNMDVVLVKACMLWQTYALEHACYYGLVMDALVNVCSQTWMLLWFGQGLLGCEAGFHSRMLCSRSTGHITKTLKM